MNHGAKPPLPGRRAGWTAGAVGRSAISYVAVLVATWLLISSGARASQVTLVSEGQSRYCIYHAPNAPKSVRRAAHELRKFVHLSTGAMLAIKSVRRPPDCPLISLGANAALSSAGIDLAGMAFDGYRIAVKAGNLYLAGPDTSDVGRTPRGGRSTGTLNATYTFLEDFLGVRWLMPGTLGEHVPSRKEVVVPATLDRSDRPRFASRRIAYVQNDNPLVRQWLRRLKQGSSIQLRDGHAWHDLVPPAMYETHPEWFALIGGVRQPPVGDRYKLETTDPALVDAVAARIVAAFRANKGRFTESISPTDSGNWSTSQASRALYDRDPRGKLSVTPLVLKFYTDVARRVARTLPDKKLCGYIYAQYLYPPSTGLPSLPDNLCLVLAPNFSYGYGLFRQAARRDWEGLVETWSAPGQLRLYYDLPTVYFPDAGVPQPLGLDILQFIYPRLAAAGYSGIYIYGTAGWGHNALTNYVLAKLNWNPGADVKATADEFLELAYGRRAGAAMGRFYATLDAAMRSFHQVSATADEEFTVALLKNVYLPAMPALASHFRDAMAGAASARQKLRLELFRMSLATLYRRLVDGGLVDAASVPADLARSTGSAGELDLKRADIALAVPKWLRRADALRLRRFSLARSEPLGGLRADRSRARYLLRGTATLVVFPDGSDPARLSVAHLRRRAEDVDYTIYDARGKPIATHLLRDGRTVALPTRAGRRLFVRVRASDASYHLALSGARFALSTAAQPAGVNYLPPYPTTYFHVPEGTKAFSVTINTESLRENAAADLVRPDGTVVASMDTSGGLSARGSVSGEAQPGFWKVVWKKPATGLQDDVWLKLDRKLPQWVVVTPETPLVVQAPRSADRSRRRLQ